MTNYILYMIDMQDDIIHAVLFLSIVQLVCYVCMYYTGLNPGGGVPLVYAYACSLGLVTH